MKWVIRIAVGIVGVIVLAGVTLFAMGHRSGAGHFHAATEIQAPRDQIWPYLEDGPKLKQWVSWLVEVRQPEAATVGAKRVWVMRDENNGGALMQIDGTYTEYAPPSRIAMRTTVPGAFEGDWVYRLTDLGNGRTRMEVDSAFHFASAFARLMEPLITPSAEKKMVGDLARLKSLIEATAR